MPTYQFKCDGCGHGFEITESIKTFKPRKKCPQCKKNKLYQVFGVPFAIVNGSDRNTLGTLADRNVLKIGRDEISEREARREEELEQQRLNTPLPEGMSHAKRSADKAWWRKGKKKQNRKLGKMTNKQKADYIFKGIEPNAKS